MNHDVANFHVLTGGPGAGKTTLIEALAGMGYVTTEEAGRGIIRDQVAIGGNALPWADRTLYAELMLSWDMRSHALARRQGGPVFFDRGVPDVKGYLTLCGLPVPARVQRTVETIRYAPTVFLLPPWPEIFGQDAERRQSFEEAERTCAVMQATYREAGYSVVEVPRAPIIERAAFVLDAISAQAERHCASRSWS